jgi:DNA-binding PadR family transcriptional regulator
MDASTVDDELPLTPAVFHILLVLAGGEAHGYAIMLAAAELSDGKLRLGPGTLYRSLYQLTRAGLVEEVKPAARQREARPRDSRRLVYRLTRTGLRLAQAEARRLDALVRVARRRHLLDAR